MNDRAKFILQYAGSCEIEFDVDYLDVDIKTPNWKPSKWTDITLIWSMPEAFRLNLKDLSEISDEDKKRLAITGDIHKSGSGYYYIGELSPFPVYESDFLRSRGYLLPFTVAVEKPTVRDFECTGSGHEAYKKALSEWNPSKTYSIEEIKELGWVKT